MGTEIAASLNITMPVFFMMMLGVLFRRLGWMTEKFARDLNGFVFRIPLPVSIFMQLYRADFLSVWDMPFVLFCFLVTLAQILIAVVLSLLIRKHELRGEFVQASYRSSTALLGLTYLQQAYNSASASALMMVGCVPLYNVAAVILLNQKEGKGRAVRASLVKSILLNPIILGIVLGFIFTYLHIQLPGILEKTASNVGALASPAGLMAMGASIDFRKLGDRAKQILSASALKLVVFPALFLPLAVHLGYRGEKLMALLIMTGSATTVASYVMAKQQGCEGELTAGSVMLTTLLTSVTLTVFIFVMKHMGLL